MAFNASVNLGTVGNGITGQTVSISGCTGSSCGSGCTSLATSQAVSSFPKTLSGIPDGTVSLFVKVDGGDCSGTSQCITVTGLPGATPTPTSTGTATPTSTIGVTPTPTGTSTSTPTSTGTPTLTGTPTITPTVTPTTCLTGDLTTTGNCSGSDLSTFTLASGYKVTVEPQGYFYSGTGTRYAYAYLRTSAGADIQQFTLTQVGSSTPTFSPTGYTLTTPGTYQLYVQQVDCNQGGGTGGSGAMNLDVRDCQVYTATPTPTTTQQTVYAYYRAGEVMESSLSTTYCDGIGTGGQGYLINSPFYTTDAILTPGVTTIYSDSNLQNIVQGSWSSGNITRMAYITEFENQQAQNTPTTTNPNGDLLYDGGTYKFMRVDSNGLLITLGTDSCGGGGGPAEV
jgi:hypothetical protein